MGNRRTSNSQLPMIMLIQILISSHLMQAEISQTSDINGRFDSLSFEQGFSILWGQPILSENGSKVELTLNEHTGSGFMSQDNYFFGFFSASIKLPADNTAGVVIAFYTSNGDAYPENHDELDFEFLGNLRGKEWTMQTNIYGNGSVDRGREERFKFWFDPTAAFHDYSIVWNDKHIVFMVDNIPIRTMQRTSNLAADYPSKPMALYATIWDGSAWATDGGKYPVDYKYAPFVATFTNLKLEGCAKNPLEGRSDPCESSEYLNPAQATDLFFLNEDQEAALEWVRSNHLHYSYCDDKNRYPVSLPECVHQKPALSSSSKSLKKHESMRRRRLRPTTRGRALVEYSPKLVL